MKKILGLVLLIVSINVFGQNPTNYQYRVVRERSIAAMFDSSLHIPRYNGTPSGLRTGSSTHDGAIAMDTANGRFYIYHNTSWVRMASFSELATASRFGAEDVRAGENRYFSGAGTYDFTIDSVGFLALKASSTVYAQTVSGTSTSELGTGPNLSYLSVYHDGDSENGSTINLTKSKIEIFPKAGVLYIDSISYNSGDALVGLAIDTLTNRVYRKTAGGSGGGRFGYPGEDDAVGEDRRVNFDDSNYSLYLDSMNFFYAGFHSLSQVNFFNYNTGVNRLDLNFSSSRIQSPDGNDHVDISNSQIWFTLNTGDSLGSTVLPYNSGSRLVHLAQDTVTGRYYRQTASGGSSTWNGITNPTGDQALTFDAGESSTWTNSNTSEDLFTVNSSTITSSSFLSLNSTSTALASGNNLVELIMSGANGTNAITANPLRISVTNTNGTSGTNTGILITASGATTANYAIDITAGVIRTPAGTSSIPAIMFESGAGFFKTGTGGIGWNTSGGGGYGALGSGSVELYPISLNGITRGGGNVGTSVTASLYLGVGNVSWLYQLGESGSSANDQTLRAQNTTGTNVTGSNLINQSGLGTGTGISGNWKVQTGVPTTTGTTAHTNGDRLAVVGKYTTLTETTATSFARVSVPTESVSGGQVVVTVEANDGTEFQARTLTFAWSAANKAGTTDADISTPVETVSISSGTLTVTITVVDAGSGNVDFKADATSSLTQTVLRAQCVVTKNFGTGTIIAQ